MAVIYGGFLKADDKAMHRGVSYKWTQDFCH